MEHYNHVRLHSAIGYVTPADKLAGRDAEIFAARDRKLEAARERRRQARRLALPVMMDYNTKRPGRRIGQRRGATRAPTQGTEIEGWTVRPRAVLLPFRSWSPKR